MKVTRLLTVLAALFPVLARAQAAPAADPRANLGAGWLDAKAAASHMELVGHASKPQGFFDPADLGSIYLANSDLAFRGNLVFQGSFNGFQIWDVSQPASPKLRLAYTCPGGQGDPSVIGNLLFISVEMPNGRVDCGTQGITDSVSTAHFAGVRIFDISDLDHPKQVAAVQTCRGSHTHTLVPDPRDPGTVYLYVSGTAPVRSPNELAGCSRLNPSQDPNSSLFRIEIIRVPLASPQDAKVIGSPRIFADSSGSVAGLWMGGSHGPGTQSTSATDQCHDITVYTEIGLAAGACSGNGIILDIKDPANPRRIAAATDPNFAYWHSATFSNDGSKVLFSDEWGGGMQARCQASDRPEWGADAIFTLGGGKMQHAGYYKLPVPQTATENCVAHNGSLIPVPGRDIMAQAWYQGGVSVFDFTDPAHPVEIASFDRGPLSATNLLLGGDWAAYWYNGLIYASEIGRGLDVFRLQPSAWLSQNEIEAAKLVHLDRLNVQNQTRFVWPASFVVARAYLDQLLRNDGLRRNWVTPVSRALDAAEKSSGAARAAALTRLATQLDHDAATAGDPARVRALAGVVRDLAKGGH